MGSVLYLYITINKFVSTHINNNNNNTILGISLADETTGFNNTTVELNETPKSENVNKNNSIKSDEEYLSLNDGIEFAYQSPNQTVPNEESLVKDTDLSVDELREQMSLL